MALDTLAGVRGEMARLYRLGLNGRIRSDEMTRFIYALKEIRACLEAEILIALARLFRRLADRLTRVVHPGTPVDQPVAETVRSDAAQGIRRSARIALCWSHPQ